MTRLAKIDSLAARGLTNKEIGALLQTATKKQLLDFIFTYTAVNHGVYRSMPVEQVRGCALRFAEQAS